MSLRYRIRLGENYYEVGREAIVVGRATTCGISLNDPLCSREHLKLWLSADGLMAADLGSRNGVILNGEALKGPALLKNNDQLELGGSSLRVHIGALDRDAETAGDGNPSARLHPSQMVFQLIEKNIALGRDSEALRLLHPITEALSSRSSNLEGREAIQAKIEVQLMSLARRGGIDAALELFKYLSAEKRLPSLDTVDSLYQLPEGSRRLLLGAATEYIKLMSQLAVHPAERFILNRLLSWTRR